MASCRVGDLEDYVSMSSLDDFPKIFLVIPDAIVILSLSLDCYFNIIVYTKLTFSLTCKCPRLLPRRLLEMCHLGTSK